MARDLARVLGKVAKKDDFYENDEWIIDCAVGHLVELFMPDDFDKSLNLETSQFAHYSSRVQVEAYRKQQKEISTIKKAIKKEGHRSRN